MNRCPACGHENEPAARFCSHCAAPLHALQLHGHEERKLLTVLFADIVDFTARAETLDPEDVRALLTPYFARLRKELQRFGGTVEKFIGDAVVALFGAPVAHDDDPVRAVRAALAIRDWVMSQRSDLQLRIAVNTGEALISLQSHPESGEGMASGDVVNTASRLQAVAPINGVLVTANTYRATRDVIEYEPAPSVSVKGKADPIPVWLALRVRPDADARPLDKVRAPFLGRTAEIETLHESLTQAHSNREAQLITVTGVPGIGKSRLIAEFCNALQFESDDSCLCLKGRSLPYGDGITFWALSEIVKTYVGILETDSPESGEAKLRHAVAALIADLADARWLERLLRPLAGLPADPALQSGGSDEAFTGWRRFFEAIAATRRLVLVFEDLHWADDSLLDFVEYLVDWTVDVPLLVLCSARSDLLERRPGWSSGRGALVLPLQPLAETETAELVGSLSLGLDIDRSSQEAVVSRVGGNPLYAEQFVRMMAETQAIHELPATVQGIISARLDALPPEEKQLLQDASVIGRVFWLGSVGRRTARQRTAQACLHALERKEFVRRVRHSSVANEAEYAFAHLLVRDVAYGQIPRAERAEKHWHAADWIASLGRSEDHAEMLAHHYVRALELRRSAGLPDAPELLDKAVSSLAEAGKRAASLNAYPAAARFYESACALAPSGSSMHAQLTFELGRMRFLSGDTSPYLLTEAARELMLCDDVDTAAEAEAVLGELYWMRGEREHVFEHLGRARQLVGEGDPSRAKAFVLSDCSRFLMLAGDAEEAITLGYEALELADELGLEQLRAHALNNIGAARQQIGDARGMQDLEESLLIARKLNAPVDATRATGNLAAMLWQKGQLAKAHQLWVEAEREALHFGESTWSRWFTGCCVWADYVIGDWTSARRRAEQLINYVEGGTRGYFASTWYVFRALIGIARGEMSAVYEDVENAIRLARMAKDPQTLYPVMAAGAFIYLDTGSTERASEILDEIFTVVRSEGRLRSAPDSLHMLAWVASAAGRQAELTEQFPAEPSAWKDAALAFATGDIAGAADICAAMGARTEEARDRLWLATDLVEQGRYREADAQLREALAFYQDVGARHYIRQCESLLQSAHAVGDTG